MEHSINKISLDKLSIQIPNDTIGIDMGQTLTKVALVEGNDLNLLIMPTLADFKEIKTYLMSKKDQYNKFIFTGGKAFSLNQEFSNELESKLLNEFEANSKGIEMLYLLTKKKELPPSLVVSIGTGTSIVLKKESFQHLGGTALGGGFFMGLLKLVFNETSYKESVEAANKGDRYGIDLKVSDIYDADDNRVDNIFREFTAASFGKVEDIKSIKKEDFIHSVISLIAENIGMLASFLADKENVKDIVFCGGFTIDNKILKKSISRICMFQKKKAVFLKNAEFMGAIGALLS